MSRLYISLNTSVSGKSNPNSSHSTWAVSTSRLICGGNHSLKWLRSSLTCSSLNTSWHAVPVGTSIPRSIYTISLARRRIWATHSALSGISLDLVIPCTLPSVCPCWRNTIIDCVVYLSIGITSVTVTVLSIACCSFITTQSIPSRVSTASGWLSSWGHVCIIGYQSLIRWITPIGISLGHRLNENSLNEPVHCSGNSSPNSFSVSLRRGPTIFPSIWFWLSRERRWGELATLHWASSSSDDCSDHFYCCSLGLDIFLGQFSAFDEHLVVDSIEYNPVTMCLHKLIIMTDLSLPISS